jgi:hypothetical protein
MVSSYARGKKVGNTVIFTSNQAAKAEYTNLKASLSQAAGKSEAISKDGDNVRVQQDTFVKSGDRNYEVKAGSHFDNDVKTEDTISFTTQTEEGVAHRTYTNYPKKKLVFFTDDRLKVEEKIQMDGGFASRTSDFSL